MGNVTIPWERDFPPFRIFGNLYFVGTEPASVHIIDTGSGLIMLDTGYQHALYLVLDHMYTLGLDPHEIKYILLTHGHIDHFGAASALRQLTGAKIALGAADRTAANGTADLSFAGELGMDFHETFEPDLLLQDGDTVTLGNTTVCAMATPGHTAGAMSYFFDVTDGVRTVRAALHGGMGSNSLTTDYLTRHHLPLTLREDYVCSMRRLAEQPVELFLGNHMQHNRTPEKYQALLGGDPNAFLVADEWRTYNLWCIDHLREQLKTEEL